MTLSATAPTSAARTPASRGSENIGHRTARGFAWMASQSIATKVISTVGQIVIAWYLVKEDFGLAAIAYMFSVVPTLIQQGGIKEVLVQRHWHFRRWANPAFWMSMSLGLAGGAVMAVMAPLAAHWYGEPRLLGLLLIIAVLFPLDSLSIVPMAHIQGQMRFRFAAALAACQVVAQTGLSLVFAKAGCGAYSLLLPRPIIAVFTAAVCWSMAAAPINRRMQVRRWRFLVGDSTKVIAANACDLLMQFGGYLVLSVCFDKATVGLYYVAFNLSVQTTVLITQSLGGVLFPALSKLQDEGVRQSQAFLRATRLLACIAFPACFLQAAVADPAMRIVYPDRLHDAIPLVQYLSIGMALTAIGQPAIALFQAQGRFGARLRLSIGSVILFFAFITMGASWGGPRGVAIAVALHLVIVEPLRLWYAIRPAGLGWKDLWGALWAPAALGLASIGPAWWASELVPEVAHRDVWRACVVVGGGGLLYFPLAKLLASDVWDDGVARIRAVIGR